MTAKQNNNLFAVYHTFEDHILAEEWWTNRSEAKSVVQQKHGAGVFCHSFMPASLLGPILSIWECEGETSEEEFQSIVGEIVTDGALVNKVYRLPPGALMRTPSAFPEMPAPQTETTGSFFWTVSGASEAFWTSLAALDVDEYSKVNHQNGVRNHCFLPTGVSKLDPVFCVWETRRPMSADEFQAFVNRPMSPTAGAFTNAVYPFLPGALVPPAAFPKKTSFMASAAFPMMDDMMGMMEQMKPVADVEAKDKAEMKQFKNDMLHQLADDAALDVIMNNIMSNMPLKISEMEKKDMVLVGKWSKAEGELDAFDA